MRTNSYDGRIVGGAEEAALRFLLDIQVAETLLQEECVSGCQSVAMGKVAWDANQVNRSLSLKVKACYPEMNLFDIADWHWRNRRRLATKKGDSFIVPQSPVPELVAANLATERHWCSQFVSLVSEKKDVRQLLFEREGLAKMKDAIKDEDDVAIINSFQEAWRWKMHSLYERARRDHLDADRLLEVEREKVRNSILRMKNSEMLAGWFLRFCADATNGGSLQSVRNESERVRKFIFSPRNFDRFQNLCLFALVSYESKQSVSTGA